MEQGALRLPGVGDGILAAPRLMTAWGLAGEKGVVAGIVSYHLKKEKRKKIKRKSPPKKETLLAL